jgi:hypothetical protein
MIKIKEKVANIKLSLLDLRNVSRQCYTLEQCDRQDQKDDFEFHPFEYLKCLSEVM